MPIATKSSKIDITQESVTASLAKKFSKVFKNGDIVFLYGEIGVGKTTFVKYLINSFQQKNKDQKTEVTNVKQSNFFMTLKYYFILSSKIIL